MPKLLLSAKTSAFSHRGRLKTRISLFYAVAEIIIFIFGSACQFRKPFYACVRFGKAVVRRKSLSVFVLGSVRQLCVLCQDWETAFCFPLGFGKAVV